MTLSWRGLVTGASPGIPGVGGAHGWRVFLSLCRQCPVEWAASHPSNGDWGSLAAGGALAPAAGAPCRVGRSTVGAGRRAPRGEGQGCLGPPHPGIREWLNYSGFVATGAHGYVGGQDLKGDTCSTLLSLVVGTQHAGLPPGVSFPHLLRKGCGLDLRSWKSRYTHVLEVMWVTCRSVCLGHVLGCMYHGQTRKLTNKVSV